MNKSNPFKGYDWGELADFWELHQESDYLISNYTEEDAPRVYESRDIDYWVSGTKVTVTTQDEEEVRLIKLKEYIQDKLVNGELTDNTRDTLNAFLDKLIKESEKTNYDHPAFKGIRNIEDDSTFVVWFLNNLDAMWT